MASLTDIRCGDEHLGLCGMRIERLLSAELFADSLARQLACVGVSSFIELVQATVNATASHADRSAKPCGALSRHHSRHEVPLLLGMFNANNEA